MRPLANNKGRSPARRAQVGFTLVELMIAAAISLFMLLGFTIAFTNMKAAFTSQDQLSQLQDNERLVILVLNNTIQSAGYFPDPLVSTATLNLPAVTGSFGSMAIAQGIFGTAGANGVSDTITTRYVSNSGDNLMDCLGQVNSSGAKAIILNTFSVSPSKELMCSIDGGTTSIPLVSNVSSLAVSYGCDSDANGYVDKYLTATQVSTATAWNLVKTARVTISFENPFAGQPGQAATIDWVQTINLMNKV